MKYSVSRNDRFSQIATRHGLTPLALLALNPGVPRGRTLSGAPCVREDAWREGLALEVGRLGDDDTTDTNQQCEPGQIDDQSGACRDETAADCAANETFDPAGDGTGKGKHCWACPGQGSVYDLTTHECVCPAGTGWSDKDAACTSGSTSTEKPPTHEAGGTEKAKGMSTTTKVAIGVGAAGVLGVAGWFFLRKKRGKR